MTQVIPEAAVDEFTKEFPKCGLTIAAPTFIVQERPTWDPAMDTFRTRVHYGPNDVEYETHIAACK